MLQIVFFLANLIYQPSCAQHPGKLYREHWGNQLMHTNLINLTLLMVKDAMYKLRMADIVQEEYKGTLPYELGLLTSGILDKFKHMLRIYRYYGNLKDFKAHAHPFYLMLNGYSSMQSDYNEIRADRDLYIDVLDRYEKRKLEVDQKIALFAKRNPGISEQALKDAHAAGIKPPLGLITRRSMNDTNDTKIANNTIQEPVKKSRRNVTRVIDVQEEEYKKKMRYILWAERWKGFNPEVEGVDIPEALVKVGFANKSNFLLKEFKGPV